MARGKPWQRIYDPDSEPPSAEYGRSEFQDNVGPEGRLVLQLTDADLRQKVCRTSDFRGEFSRVKFRVCRFESCQFDEAIFTEVVFWNCTFVNCHFEAARFTDCRFEECSFETNSVSSNYLFFDRTFISARGFVSAITANPVEDPDYTLNRLAGTRVDIARKILDAIPPERDDAALYEAVREHATRRLRWKRASLKDLPKKRFSWLSLHVRKIILSSEFVTTYLAGELTNWGGSVVRPVGFMTALTILFALLYSTSGATETFTGSLLRAVDVSLVAGYSKYDQFGWVGYASLLHMILSVFGFGLLIGVLTHRVLR